MFITTSILHSSRQKQQDNCWVARKLSTTDKVFNLDDSSALGWVTTSLVNQVNLSLGWPYQLKVHIIDKCHLEVHQTRLQHTKGAWKAKEKLVRNFSTRISLLPEAKRGHVHTYLCYALLERQLIHVRHVQNVTCMRILGCWEGIQIIWSIFLKRWPWIQSNI